MTSLATALAAAATDAAVSFAFVGTYQFPLNIGAVGEWTFHYNIRR